MEKGLFSLADYSPAFHFHKEQALGRVEDRRNPTVPHGKCYSHFVSPRRFPCLALLGGFSPKAFIFRNSVLL